MKLVNLLDLLEATGDDEDQRLAERLREALTKIGEEVDTVEVELGGY